MSSGGGRLMLPPRFAFRFRLAVLLVDQVDDLRRGREAHGSIDPNPGHTGVADGLLQFHGRELLVERCFHALRAHLVDAVATRIGPLLAADRKSTTLNSKS